MACSHRSFQFFFLQVIIILNEYIKISTREIYGMVVVGRTGGYSGLSRLAVVLLHSI
jgi:hypothetical protein